MQFSNLTSFLTIIAVDKLNIFTQDQDQNQNYHRKMYNSSTMTQTPMHLPEVKCLQNQSLNQDDNHMYIQLSTFWYNFLALITTIGLLVSFISNLIIVYIFASTPSVRKNPSNLIAANLSLSDMLYCVQWPSVIYCSLTQTTWILEYDFVCKALGFITVSTALVSIVTVFVMAVERSIVIRYSIHAKGKPTNKQAWLVILVIWTICLWSCVPPLFGMFNRYTLDPSKTSCTLEYLTLQSDHKNYITCLFIIFYVIPIIGITISYVFIIIHFNKSTRYLRKVASANRNSTDELNNANNNNGDNLTPVSLNRTFSSLHLWSKRRFNSCSCRSNSIFALMRSGTFRRLRPATGSGRLSIESIALKSLENDLNGKKLNVNNRPLHDTSSRRVSFDLSSLLVVDGGRINNPPRGGSSLVKNRLAISAISCSDTPKLENENEQSKLSPLNLKTATSTDAPFTNSSLSPLSSTYLSLMGTQRTNPSESELNCWNLRTGSMGSVICSTTKTTTTNDINRSCDRRQHYTYSNGPFKRKRVFSCTSIQERLEHEMQFREGDFMNESLEAQAGSSIKLADINYDEADVYSKSERANEQIENKSSQMAPETDILGIKGVRMVMNTSGRSMGKSDAGNNNKHGTTRREKLPQKVAKSGYSSRERQAARKSNQHGVFNAAKPTNKFPRTLSNVNNISHQVAHHSHHHNHSRDNQRKQRHHRGCRRGTPRQPANWSTGVTGQLSEVSSVAAVAAAAVAALEAATYAATSGYKGIRLASQRAIGAAATTASSSNKTIITSSNVNNNNNLPSTSGSIMHQPNCLNTQAEKSNKARNALQFRLAKMSFYLILLWLVSWSPIAWLAMLNSIFECRQPTATAVFLAHTMTKLGPTFDVFIYGLSHPKLKSKFTAIIRRMFRLRW